VSPLGQQEHCAGTLVQPALLRAINTPEGNSDPFLDP
jgi:hypothetical protein